MPIETATYLTDLNTTYPEATDEISKGDDHLRLLKTVLKSTFPGVDAPIALDVTTAGSANTYTATLSPAPAAYVDGMLALVKINVSNTGASTINFNSLGAKKILGQRQKAMRANALHADSSYLMKYHSDWDSASGAFELLTPLAIEEGLHTIWIPAGSMTPRTTSGCAALAQLESTTNKVMTDYLAFDSSSAEYAQFGIWMPKSWDEGTVTAQFIWTHPATVTNFGVAWEIAGVAFGDDDTLDAAFGTAQTVTDTGGTTSDLYATSATSDMTIAGTPAQNDYVVFQVNRAPANGSDTMAVDAYLIGVKLFYTVIDGNDA